METTGKGNYIVYVNKESFYWREPTFEKAVKTLYYLLDKKPKDTPYAIWYGEEGKKWILIIENQENKSQREWLKDKEILK